MRAKVILAAVFLVILVASYAGRLLLERSGPHPNPLPQGEGTDEANPLATEAGTDEGAVSGGRLPARIVSMSPNVTETLFALGLGDRVVGVSRYCTYPPEAQTKAQVGGYLDPNYEAILALEPDLVMLPAENEEFVLRFRKLGLATLTVRHNSIEEVLDSIATIGRRCGAQDQAGRLVAGIRNRIDAIARKTAGLARPRVMLVVERTLGAGRAENVCIAGADRFMNQLVEMAGGVNCCGERRVGFPTVSLEGILQMNPQVILDLVATDRQGKYARETLLADWRALGQVEAVRDGRVWLVDDDYVFIPGPRLALSVERLARLIHPELKWEP
jgi:iron complex transport system substrate-binding protein